MAWAGNERLIFTSEHRGWHHAFSVATAGGDAVDLTPGASEIESFAVSPDGATVYFWGNHGDVNRRHVWRVPSAGGAATAVTVGTGIEVEPTPLADGETLALRRADARYPMAIALVKSDGSDLRTVNVSCCNSGGAGAGYLLGRGWHRDSRAAFPSTKRCGG